ncbi:single-strand DNA-specific exonuclease RecJ [Helicobacter cinaedi PAGU611]|uniref:single-stranded-DNA-specific exonuclease RecJ n=1 Tax=Helicobacter cinaedi TaxID=213 RepID=UPI00025D3388|nr:single-stranded-DNA-specific exonuclease RecJ [Helicobacter cinaedi]BAM11731.1 single-strand DNA-specific exonuclease RecJ [Helicobacter cinaedi PAGU611]
MRKDECKSHTKQDILHFLQSRDLECGIRTLRDLPTPQNLNNTESGAKIITQAMERNNEILVVGDYDADGVCASAIISLFFKALEYQHFRLIIPHRFEDGYGVSAALLEKNAQNAAVVVSVDNGITAFCAGQWCKAKGIPFIITDHHTPTDTLPQADVIINPMLQDSTFAQKSICGAVVAWYFCAAIKQNLKANIDMGMFLEYLAIATIADVMPLTGINRILVKKGLESLRTSSNVLATLLRESFARFKKPITAENLAFDFIPLLNCAGRMESANKALELLLSPSLAHATHIYTELQNLNNKRKEIQQDILQKAQEHIIQTDDFVLSYGDSWHEGVLGIVAAKLARIYKKSAFVLSQNADVLKGSGRSYGGANLIASITPLQQYCLGLGGHSGAVGLSLESCQLGTLIEKLQETMVYEECDENETFFTLGVESVDMELFEILESFEPFGEGNPKPTFLLENLTIQEIKPLGREGKHFEYTLADSNGMCLAGLEFLAPTRREVGQCVDIHIELMRDYYKNCIKAKILEVFVR